MHRTGFFAHPVYPTYMYNMYMSMYMHMCMYMDMDMDMVCVHVQPSAHGKREAVHTRHRSPSV